MTYEVIILGHLHMPLYFIGTFTEYPLLYVRDWRMVLLAILRTNHGDGAIVRNFRTIAPSP